MSATATVFDPADFRRRREAAGLSVAEMARRLGVVPNSVSRWQSGRTPAPEMLARIERVFDGKPATGELDAVDVAAVRAAAAILCALYGAIDHDGSGWMWKGSASLVGAEIDEYGSLETIVARLEAIGGVE